MWIGRERGGGGAVRADWEGPESGSWELGSGVGGVCGRGGGGAVSRVRTRR